MPRRVPVLIGRVDGPPIELALVRDLSSGAMLHVCEISVVSPSVGASDGTTQARQSSEFAARMGKPRLVDPPSSETDVGEEEDLPASDSDATKAAAGAAAPVAVASSMSSGSLLHPHHQGARIGRKWSAESDTSDSWLPPQEPQGGYSGQGFLVDHVQPHVPPDYRSTRGIAVKAKDNPFTQAAVAAGTLMGISSSQASAILSQRADQGANSSPPIVAVSGNDDNDAESSGIETDDASVTESDPDVASTAPEMEDDDANWSDLSLESSLLDEDDVAALLLGPNEPLYPLTVPLMEPEAVAAYIQIQLQGRAGEEDQDGGSAKRAKNSSLP
ncbi:hypothetical protein BC828DRAFT_431694 [Blastocladiella britannica]|nr:hypothetical protein BC828DRAFT_431694 [Blastocladiella britannica]